MFNFYSPQVQESVGTVQQQAQRAQEIDGEIKAAIQVIQQGKWLGESEVSFAQDAARLETSIQTLHTSLADFIAHLSQASGFAGEAMASISGVIGSLP